MDVFDEETRSRVMASVRGRDTKPEMAVRRYLHARGLRFRLHRRDLPGRPDLVFPSRRVAVFVHGCFWHQRPGCRRAKLPRTRADFWRRKLEGNVERDAAALAELEAGGWTALVVWECEVGPEALEALYERIVGSPMV
ncbi:very short patch repair endonuclease [Roseicyclus elongatus]|uniref:very short patch repair endonuclease n=1 Tax=Roseicyclus elongatus TaxID=159346 RepID=UPI00046C9348|nr:very short patch repair endonuclease [Roseibacterium elongatum]